MKECNICLWFYKRNAIRVRGSQGSIGHTTTLGDTCELKWIDWLKKYLPERYCIDKAFIIDSKGNLSQQIDVVIYDRTIYSFYI